MRPFDAGQLRFGERPVQYYPIAATTTKAELGLDVALEGDTYCLNFQYATGLYQKDTVALYARSMTGILEGLVAARHETLGEISPVSLDDYTRLIEFPDYTTQPFLNLPIHQQIRREAMLYRRHLPRGKDDPHPDGTPGLPDCQRFGECRCGAGRLHWNLHAPHPGSLCRYAGHSQGRLRLCAHPVHPAAQAA